ncbi:FAD-binding oxidoreductase [Lutibacter sp.]|uniref:NAD(P)/FAD-dependent oxidoreductase n=1 Tax=Lutibacter sp. TaxID=1925666 RepID=UPI001A2D4948|nr:FAD-binding oxidoreductase [Lutibacter sp.]MBI9040513.1 FAD-binding oxidoreductase [Lutibacter sp.]
MKVDYIIVGLGLAGLAFSKELEKNNKSFIVFENNSQNSSIVAGGVYNPVILKRFTPVWEAKNQLEIAIPFYSELEDQFKKKYNYSLDIFRIFKSIEEQNNWFIATDHQQLSEYMIPKIENSKIKGIISNYGYGKLINTGWVDTKNLLEDYRNYLSINKKLLQEDFQYTTFNIQENSIIYNSITCSKIVFCEGFGIKQNPYFNYLPMQEAKGELIIIHAPNLNVNALIKAAVFVLPLGDNYYKIGATFNWNHKTSIPTDEGKNELKEKLDTFINVPYKIVEQLAGIRPTVKDRRPLLGTHPNYPNLAVLNGLGTRGVMIAPTAAKQLYNYLENKIEINNEYSILRFLKN